MGSRARDRWIMVGVACVIGLAFAATGSIDDRANAAKKPGGYGGRGGGGKGYAKSCKKGCKSALKTCLFCRKQDLKAAKSACQGLAKSEVRKCRQSAKHSFKTLKKNCKERTGGCSSCCRQSYGSDCQAQFAGTPGHGTFFRRYCSGYGGRKQCRKVKPDCGVSGDADGNIGGDGGSGGTGNGATDKACLRACEKQYLVALRTCEATGACDIAAIEAELQNCRSACGATRVP